MESGTGYHQCFASLTEAGLEIRKAVGPEDVARAVALDEAVVGSKNRCDYIASVAEKDGLSVAVLHGRVQAFCCIDHGYFFQKPFVSLLVVSGAARRLGLGTALLSQSASKHPEVWTSTNQLNTAMRKLLDKLRWLYCGKLEGLDEGDPERFYRTP